MATYEDNIDEGTVSFEDGDKAADKTDQYDVSRKVRVELKFSVFEGQDGVEVLRFTGDAARAEVARLLGGKAPAVSAPQGEAQAGEPTKRTRRTKEQIAADEAAKQAGAPTTGVSGGAQTSADPAAVEDFDPTAEIPATETTDDGLDLSEFDVQPEAEVDEVITDADLNSAVQKKNGELGDPPRIRELIGSYNPDPKSVFQLRQIPAGKRREFLDKLAALKKAA